MDNRCYSPDFIHFIRRMFPTAPLWANFLLYKTSKKLIEKKRTKDVTTQGTIEIFFKLVKHDDFQGKHHLRIDEFVSLQKGFIEARCHVYGDTIQQQTAMKRKRKSEEDDINQYSGSLERLNKKVKKMLSPDKRH